MRALFALQVQGYARDEALYFTPTLLRVGVVQFLNGLSAKYVRCFEEKYVSSVFMKR